MITTLDGERATTYGYRFWLNGVLYKQKGFPSKTLATHAEDARRRGLQLGHHEAQHGPVGAPRKLLWKDALTEYQTIIGEKKLKDQAKLMARLTWWADWATRHGATYIHMLTGGQIMKACRELAATPIPSREAACHTERTCHHYFANLRAFYNTLRKNQVKGGPLVNPTTEAEAPTPEKYQPHILELAEDRERLLAAASPTMRHMILIAMFAGFRREAVMQLKMEDFERTPGWIHGVDLKRHGKPVPYTVPMTPPLKGVLDEIRRAGLIKGSLWRNPDGTTRQAFPTRQWRQALRQAGLMRVTERPAKVWVPGTPGPKPKPRRKESPMLTFHSLRHLCGVTLAEAGVVEAVIQAYLHHSTRDASRIYTTWVSKRSLLEAAGKLTRRLTRRSITARA